MLEDLPGVASIRRSYSLVRGSMLRVIGYSLIFALIASLIGLVASFVSVLVGFALSSPTLGGTTSTVSSTAVVAQTLITSLFSEVLIPIYRLASCCCTSTSAGATVSEFRCRAVERRPAGHSRRSAKEPSASCRR